MGSLFSSPAPPAPVPLPKLDVPDPEAEEHRARLDALKRRRRGRAGTVRTSQRGVLRQRDDEPGGKERLGE